MWIVKFRPLCCWSSSSDVVRLAVTVAVVVGDWRFSNKEFTKILRPVKTVSTFDQHWFNKSWMLGKCCTNVEHTVQTALTPFNIFENKGNLNGSLNQFEFAARRFQQAFNILRIQQY